jgi:hypothetical protein
MADMLNHKYPAETYWTFGACLFFSLCLFMIAHFLDQSLKSFTITSQKAFVSGEQVLRCRFVSGSTLNFIFRFTTPMAANVTPSFL